MKINYDCKLKDDAVVISGDDPTDTLRISFQRTIRVSDTMESSHLPPTIGQFPLFKVSDYATKLPPDMAAKGGVFMPIYQREAMWIHFTARKRFAIKIFVGGVNAISGENRVEDEETHRRRAEKVAAGKPIQDYVIVPGQMWLDGIATQDGQVRQFVAMPYGEGYSVEAQMTAEEVVGGIQFEVTPAVREPKKPAAPISGGDIAIVIRSLTGHTTDILVDNKDTIEDVKNKYEYKVGIPADLQLFIFSGKEMDDDHIISDYGVEAGAVIHVIMKLRGGGSGPAWRLAVAAGGKIKQVIRCDTSKGRLWRDRTAVTFNVQLLNAAFFKMVTGEDPPPTPISAKTYQDNGFPFFAMYEEPTAIHGNFAPVLSVAQLDGDKEEHLSFPIKTIEASKDEKKIDADSLIDHLADSTATFRHISELKELVQEVTRLSLHKRKTSDEESSAGKKVKREE